MGIEVLTQDSKGLISNVKAATEQDFAELDRQLSLERGWYADAPRFQTRQDIHDAVRSGELVQLHRSFDVLPIGRFGLGIDGFDPYLTPNAWGAVHDLGGRWRAELEANYGLMLTSNARLAITSMTRSLEYQARLVDGGRLASPDSTHCTGNAFDVDASGYYVVGLNGGGVESRVDPRRHAARQAIADELKSKHGSSDNEALKSEEYDHFIVESLIAAARKMRDEGAINLIEEFSGTENACLHIAVNPDFDK